MPIRRASFSSTANYDLLLSRLDDAPVDPKLEAALAQLRLQFKVIREALQSAAQSPEIEWSLWADVMEDYKAKARKNPVEVSMAIAAGVPNEIRGLVWQAIAESKSSDLEILYEEIGKESSPHEKAIRRDLSRTSFIKNVDPESLFKIIKAYSLFDPEVGYTQGMAFITVPLLIHLSESEAFCLLVKLMKTYGFRDFFLYEMPGLHLRLYQFDRILEDTLPEVHIHLARQGVRSAMFASQWFLTLFAYKFPLSIVQRIVDVVMAEGIEAMLRFAVGLIKRNADRILEMEFETLLAFLKENIFDEYVIQSTTAPPLPPRVGSPALLRQPVISTGLEYRINDLVADAYDVRVLPITLQKYSDEYTELERLETERKQEVEALKTANGGLVQRIRRLEEAAATLMNEHLEVTNELAHLRVAAAEKQDEMEELTMVNIELEKELSAKFEGLDEGAAEEVSFISVDSLIAIIIFY